MSDINWFATMNDIPREMIDRIYHQAPYVFRHSQGFQITEPWPHFRLPETSRLMRSRSTINVQFMIHWDNWHVSQQVRTGYGPAVSRLPRLNPWLQALTHVNINVNPHWPPGNYYQQWRLFLRWRNILPNIRTISVSSGTTAWQGLPIQRLNSLLQELIDNNATNTDNLRTVQTLLTPQVTWGPMPVLEWRFRHTWDDNTVSGFTWGLERLIIHIRNGQEFQVSVVTQAEELCEYWDTLSPMLTIDVVADLNSTRFDGLQFPAHIRRDRLI